MLCARQRNSRFSTTVAPPSAYGSSGGTPGTLARCIVPPPQRTHTDRRHAVQTALLTAAGMCREPCWRPARRTRPVGRRKLGALEIGQQERQRSIEDRRWIAVRNRVPQQILDLAQLVVRVAGHGELHLVAFGRERRDGRARPRGQWR